MPTRWIPALIALAWLAAGPALAAASSAEVALNGHALLKVGASPALSPAERAGILEHRLALMLDGPPPAPWRVVDAGGDVRVFAGDQPFVTITGADVAVNGATSAEELARRWATGLEAALGRAAYERSAQYLAIAVGLAVAATLIGLGLLRVTSAAHRRLRVAIATEASPVVGRFFGWLAHVPYFEGVDVRPALQSLNIWTVWLARLVIANGWVLVVLGLFPQTRAFNDLLLKTILAALAAIGASIVGYLPNLVTIVVTVVVTRYAIRLAGFVFGQMMHRPEDLGFGLPVELLDALSKLATGLIWVFAAMIVAPLLPGLGTQTGQVIGLIVGAMITLGSGSTVGNAVAGFVLTYMRPFEVGDRVRVGEHEGDVLERNFTNVRLRTIKNEVVTLTSNHVLSSAVVNYTTEVSRQAGLVLHTTVTIGYDVPRHRAEALLLEAARRTDGVSDAPAPFVLVTGLGDYAIAYELNVSTPYPHLKAVIFSELHKNVIDAFDEAGVEILSPAYHALRDGNHTTVAADHVPEGYVAPGFRMAGAPDAPTGPGAPAPHPDGAHRPAGEGDRAILDRVLERYRDHPHYRP